MRLFLVRSVGVLHLDFRALRLQTVEEGPAHDAHEGGISEVLSPLLLQDNLSVVIRLVAGIAQRDEIVRGVTAGFSAFEVMDVQNRILGFAVAMTALVPVTKKDILANVPEAELIALLVLSAFNGLIPDLLDVKGGSLHLDLRYGKNLRMASTRER